MSSEPYASKLELLNSPLGLITPGLQIALLIGLLLSYAVYKDYDAFRKLGPGGTSSNFLGYMRITALRLFAIRRPRDPDQLPATLYPPVGLLHQMPEKLLRRSGTPPEVTGIAPHRQTTQKGSWDDFTTLADRIKALVTQHPACLRLDVSCFEKHGTALFAKSPINKTCNGEICHAHPSDGSMHMTLHPQDARTVLELGWGELHPLAKGGWLSRFVPLGFVMVYAPRDPAELETVMRITRAASWWVGGLKLEEPKEETSVRHVENSNGSSPVVDSGNNRTMQDVGRNDTQTRSRQSTITRAA